MFELFQPSKDGYYPTTPYIIRVKFLEFTLSNYQFFENKKVVLTYNSHPFKVTPFLIAQDDGTDIEFRNVGF